MPPRSTPPLDRRESLLAARQQTEAEVQQLTREEEYLLRQLREAREQVRYYEGLLAVLRKDWGKPPPFADLVRKLG
jgi:hypothetical protein